MTKFLTTISGGLGQILSHTGDFITNGIDSVYDKKEVVATWGKESDIASPWEDGFLVTKYGRMSREASFQNVMLSSPTGSGKSSAFLIKQPLVLQGSMVITDPHGELYEKTSGYVSQYARVLSLDLSNYLHSIGWNVFAGITDPYDIRLNTILDMLVRARLERGNSDPFWSLSVKSLLLILARTIIYEPESRRHMPSVLKMLETLAGSPEKVDLKIIRTRNTGIIESYRAFCATPERTRQSIIVSARAALECFEPESVQRVTAYNTVSFSELRRTPHVLYLRHPPSQGKLFSSLVSLYFEMLYAYVLDHPVQESDQDLWVLLEELPNTFIPVLGEALSQTRKKRCGTWCCMQSYSQLRNQYHDNAATILENCRTQIFLPGVSDMDVLKRIEVLGGRTKVKDSKSGDYKALPLISVDAARMLEPGRTLILAGRNKIIKGRMSGYFESQKFKAMTSMPSAPHHGYIPAGPIPMIEFPN